MVPLGLLHEMPAETVCQIVIGPAAPQTVLAACFLFEGLGTDFSLLYIDYGKYITHQTTKPMFLNAVGCVTLLCMT